jgi:quercetin dioxygenase-like cupin family protein
MTNLRQIGLIAPKTIWKGVTARIVEGDRITMAINELDPGTQVPEHQHESEQLGFVLMGSLTFTVGGETERLGPGGTWRIIGGIPHSALAGPEGAVVLDVFSPVRVDWDELDAEAARPPIWPSDAVEMSEGA